MTRACPVVSWGQIIRGLLQTPVYKQKGHIMGQPVVHFEIIEKDLEKLLSYYGDLFGRTFDTSTSVSETVY